MIGSGVGRSTHLQQNTLAAAGREKLWRPPKKREKLPILWATQNAPQIVAICYNRGLHRDREPMKNLLTANFCFLPCVGTGYRDRRVERLAMRTANLEVAADRITNGR